MGCPLISFCFYPPPHFPRVPKIFINYRTHHPLSLGISSLLAAILAWQGAETKPMMLSMLLEHLEAAWPELLTASATPRGSAITTSADLGMALKSFSKVPLGAASSLSKWLPELPRTYGQYFPPLSKSCHLSSTQSMRSRHQKPSLGHRPGALGVIEQCLSNALK